MLSAALYNTRIIVNLVSKEGEWNETLWIVSKDSERLKRKILS